MTIKELLNEAENIGQPEAFNGANLAVMTDNQRNEKLKELGASFTIQKASNRIADPEKSKYKVFCNEHGEIKFYKNSYPTWNALLNKAKHGKTPCPICKQDKIKTDEEQRNKELEEKNATFRVRRTKDTSNSEETRYVVICNKHGEIAPNHFSDNNNPTWGKVYGYAENHQTPCPECNKENEDFKGNSSNPEVVFFNDLKGFIDTINSERPDIGLKIYGGKNKKTDTGIISPNKKHTKLDFDIYIEDKNNKAIAIQIDGNEHTIYDTNRRRNDVTRTIEARNKQITLFTFPAYKKGTSDYNRTLKTVKLFIQKRYNAWGETTDKFDKAKYKNLSPEEIEKLKQKRLERVRNQANKEYNYQDSDDIQNKLADLIHALLKNVGYNSLNYKYYNYQGKTENNLIDFMLKNPKAKESYLAHHKEWEKLGTADKTSLKSWMKNHRAIKNQNVGYIDAAGNAKLFEDEEN